MTPWKKSRHPIHFFLIKNVPKFDYSHCSIPKDDETLAHALIGIREERVRWTPARKAIIRNELIQI